MPAVPLPLPNVVVPGALLPFAGEFAHHSAPERPEPLPIAMNFSLRPLDRKPLHFILLATLLYLVLPRATPYERPQPPRVDAAQLDALRREWEMSTGRPPDATELRRMEARALDEELLVREALSRGLHLRDPVIRQRLVLNMRFLGAAADADEDALVPDALAMGMERQDVVVRRRLLQLMELSIGGPAEAGSVTDAEIDALYAVRRDTLAEPPAWRISQVYFSRERRGARLDADANAALARIRREALPFDAAQALGDPFLGGHRLPLQDAPQLDGDFGPGFAAALAGCAPRQWCGPLGSAYGLHLVWVDEWRPARVPARDEPALRQRLAADVIRARDEQRMARALDALRRKYGVSS